jgi:hypothetical protein
MDVFVPTTSPKSDAFGFYKTALGIQSARNAAKLRRARTVAVVARQLQPRRLKGAFVWSKTARGTLRFKNVPRLRRGKMIVDARKPSLLSLNRYKRLASGA